MSARFHSNLRKQNRSVADTHPRTPPPHPTANRIASSETMNSAALRSRTTKHGGEDGDDTAGPAPVLDTDAQEALVLELEKDARRQATIWRRVFGALSIAWGVYFIDCAAHAASGDVTRAWSGVRRPRTHHFVHRIMTLQHPPHIIISVPPAIIRHAQITLTHHTIPHTGDTRGVLPPRSTHDVHGRTGDAGPSHGTRGRRRRRRRGLPGEDHWVPLGDGRRRLHAVASRVDATRADVGVRACDYVWRVRVCRVGVDHAADVRVASR